MSSRFVNISLLGLMILLTVTGGLALLWSQELWLFEVHRTAGFALIALLPFKALLSARSYRRGLGRRAGRALTLGGSSLLAGLTLLVMVLALAWMWQLEPSRLRLFGLVDTLMSWHWILGFALLPLFLLHTWITWPRPRTADLLTRRSFLRLTGLSAAALAGWGFAGDVAGRREASASPRRPSGSRRDGWFSGNHFPVTSAAGDGPTLDAASWRLRAAGGVARPMELSYEEILALQAVKIVATLDCTVGWYTQQVWRGAPLATLLEMCGAKDARWIRVSAAAGYAHTFAATEAKSLLLATHVGGEVLDPAHGFPLRLVAPTRRGWFWVKWVERIEVL